MVDDVDGIVYTMKNRPSEYVVVYNPTNLSALSRSCTYPLESTRIKINGSCGDESRVVLPKKVEWFRKYSLFVQFKNLKYLNLWSSVLCRVSAIQYYSQIWTNFSEYTSSWFSSIKKWNFCHIIEILCRRKGKEIKTRYEVLYADEKIASPCYSMSIKFIYRKNYKLNTVANAFRNINSSSLKNESSQKKYLFQFAV